VWQHLPSYRGGRPAVPRRFSAPPASAPATTTMIATLDLSSWFSWARIRGACSVRPWPGDVHRRRGQELSDEHELNSQTREYLGHTREFWCCEQEATFLFYSFSFYSGEQSSVLNHHRTTGTSIPMSTALLKDRVTLGHARAILAMPIYTHGLPQTGARAHARLKG
jgi:hypothetical protein